MCRELEFMKAQIHRIDVDKWCEGVNKNYDPGEVYVVDWVYTDTNSLVKFNTFDKWCEGFNNHYDPGEVYIVDWIYANAKKFRDDWNISLCKDCSNLRECGHMALSACNRFSNSEDCNEENTVS